MDLRLSVETKGALLAGKSPQVIQQGLDRLVTMVTMFLLGEVKRRTPQGVGGAQSGLLASEQADVIGKGTPVIKGIVSTANKYGEVIEKGRTAGKGMPPPGVLIRWIQLKFGVDEKTAQRVEFVVRRKIGQKGFEGAHMFERSVTENGSRIQGMADQQGLAIVMELDNE